jgi:hypothetical protein
MGLMYQSIINKYMKSFCSDISTPAQVCLNHGLPGCLALILFPPLHRVYFLDTMDPSEIGGVYIIMGAGSVFITGRR